MDAEGTSEYYLNILRLKIFYRVSQIRWFAFLTPEGLIVITSQKGKKNSLQGFLEAS